MAAPAERGGFTRVEAAARSAPGGGQGREKYRTLLDVGQATISRVLSTAHRALPAVARAHGAPPRSGRSRRRHLLPAQAERIADEQLAPEIEASRAPDVTAWARGAVAKYVVPQPTQVKAGVYGFRPQDV
ncbi:hypothetical protein ACH4PR_46735 [Streptomyces mirabilis]|uniref:hypothetical protein n=1 Tax=Streptomyces mirabilis TaxID=68239 RepID=UPI0037AD2D26